MNEFVEQEPKTQPEGINTAGAVVESPTDVSRGVEKFSDTDLAGLRTDLLQSDVDSFQAAELVANFLSGRGYGISTDEARGIVAKIESVGCTVECIQAELERVARFA